VLGYRFISFALLLPLVAACSRAPEHDVLVLQGTTMGTGYRVQVVDLPANVLPQRLQSDIDAELALVNDLMSTYRESSELSHFNRSRSLDWFAVSPALAFLAREALWTSETSGGAFDPTVGPLVNLWGFGPGGEPDAVPSDKQIAEAQRRVGHHMLSVREAPPALRKSEPELYLDLSAIAKGYGVDRIAKLLDGAGVQSYLVEIGGELRGRGHNASGLPWRIAVERPDPGVREVHSVVELHGGAMATSGDYRNFFELDGKLYSHSIDPRTGRPVSHSLASVTVLAPTAARADALATAFLVLGPEDGLTLAESLRTAALFIVRTSNGYSDRRTTSLQAHLRQDRVAND
jgi:thiamine biosynthesis lipoprotein